MLQLIVPLGVVCDGVVHMASACSHLLVHHIPSHQLCSCAWAAAQGCEVHDCSLVLVLVAHSQVVSAHAAHKFWLTDSFAGV